MDNRVYWIWAQRAFGEGSPKPFALSRRFPGGLKEFYENGPSLWNRMEPVSEKEAHALHAGTLREAEALLEYCQKLGWLVLTPECEKYPDALRHIFDPPAVLYGKGRMPDMEAAPAVAVVGSRKPLPASEDAAKGFGFQLASGGAVVVSGGAVGVDREALLGALSAMGTVISVLPVALSSGYVIENAGLRAAIVEKGGLLLSEYASQTEVTRGTFQVRNRLLSGLCHGTLLIQAAEKSGTMITARYALEQNRDLFVWPGVKDTPAFEGSRSLLEDGAEAVICGEDILQSYAGRFPAKKVVIDLFEELPAMEAATLGTAVLADSSPAGVVSGTTGQPEEQQLRELLRQGPLPAAEISRRLGISPSKLSAMLTELELMGTLRTYPGKRYGLV